MNETTSTNTAITWHLTQWEASLLYWLQYYADDLVEFTGAMVWP